MKTAEKQITETAQESESPVLEEQENGIVRLTLNRPKQFNSLSEAMLETLQEKIDAIAENKDARLVILQGAGKAFCAGHDLKEMIATRKESYYKSLFQQCSRMMMRLNKIPQPVIARVHGIATAAGCQLVGEFIDANTALKWGLINRIAPEEKLDEEVQKLADAILSKSSVAVFTGKKMFYEQLEKNMEDAYAFAGEIMACNMMAEDVNEGIDAFVKKRTAVWKGR